MLGALTPRTPACRPRGLTLVELMVAVAIVVVLAAIAVPSMQQYVARQRVEGVAQQLVTDLRWLRTLRGQRDETVGILFGGNTAVTCYVIFALRSDRGASCDCTKTTDVCPRTMGLIEQKTVRLERSAGVTVASTPASLYVGRYDLPIGGVTLNAEVSSPLGGTVRVTTNAALLPALCSVSGSESSLKACPPPPAN